MNIDVKIYISYVWIRGLSYMKDRFIYLFIYEHRGINMKQIGTFRLKVISAIDDKKLADGKIKKYHYGSISVKSPQLADYVGKEIMVRIFVE